MRAAKSIAENERFRVYANVLKLLFRRRCHGIVLKCVPHMQHADVFFIQPIKFSICNVVVIAPVSIKSAF